MRVFFYLFIFLLSTVFIHAQDIEDLNEVLISTSTYNLNKKDVPHKVVELSKDTIHFYTPQTTADLLAFSDNIFVQKSQLGGGSPTLRGFSTNRVLITVDGVRMNNSIFRSGNVHNIISLDPSSLSNVNLVFGGGALLAGSDAIGGVISLETKAPSFSESIKLNSLARYSSAAQEKTFNLNFSNTINEKIGMFNSISFSDFDDLRMGANGLDDYKRKFYVVTNSKGEDSVVKNSNELIQKESGYNQVNLVSKIHYKINSKSNLKLGVYYSKSSDIPRYDRLIQPSDNGLKNAEWYYGPQSWLMTNLSYDLYKNKGWFNNFKSVIAYQNFKESRHTRRFNNLNKNNRSEDLDAYSMNFNFTKVFKKKHKLYYGLENVLNHVNSKAYDHNILTLDRNLISTRYPNNSVWNSFSSYLNYKFQPKSYSVFQFGLRYNYVYSYSDFKENNTFLSLPYNEFSLNNNAFTWSIGYTNTKNKNLVWRSSLSKSFRAPNIDDISKVFDSEPGAVTAPNPDLKPEIGYTIDLGLDMSLFSSFKFGVSLYSTYLDSAIVRHEYSLNGDSQLIYDGELSTVLAMQNAAEQLVYGAEFKLDYKLNSNLRFSSAYNFIKGSEYFNDETYPVRHVTPNFGNTHFVFSKNKFEVDFYALYNSKISYANLAPSELSKSYLYVKDSEGYVYSPSWFTLNLKAKYSINQSFTVFTGLENLLDKRYRSYSSGLVSPGLNASLTLEYKL